MNNTHSTCAIETSALTKKFGTFCALDHLDLKIPHQCIFGLLGPNGAGKSTAIKILTTHDMEEADYLCDQLAILH